LTNFFLDACLNQYNYFAYTTFSSTPDEPRWRIVIEADGQIPSEYYPLAAQTIADRLSFKNPGSENFVISQPMFATRICSDAKFLFIDSFLGSSFSKESITATSRPTKKRGKKGSDAAFLLSLTPKLEIEDATIQEALESIDADCPRPDWLMVAASLKHQFQDNTEKGFQLFDSWSSFGSKYVGIDDCQKMWDSLEANPDRDPCTAKTLLFMARQAGWQDDNTDDTYVTLLDSIHNEMDVKKLMNEFPKHISSVHLNRVMRDSIVLSLRDQIKKAGGAKVSIAILRKSCAYKDDDASIYETEDGFLAKADQDIKPWAVSYKYIRQTNEFYNSKSGARLKPEVFDNSYSKFLITKEEKKEGAARPAMKPTDFVLNQINIPQYDSYTYLPGRNEEVTVDGISCFNTFIDRSPEPSDKNLDYVSELITRHAYNILDGEYEVNLLLDYLAYTVQNPGAKMRWTIMLQGAQGCGKTLWGSIMHQALGAGSIGLVDNDLLDGTFTGWAENRLFIVMEEVHVSGTNRFKVMGKLKPFLTNDMIVINRKNTPDYIVPNVANYLLLTNHKNALAIENTDRRYCVLISNRQTERQVMALGEKYFKDIFDAIQENPGTVRKFFLDRKISNHFNPNGHAPHTGGKAMLVHLSKSSMQLAIEEVLCSRVPGVTKDVLSSKILLDFLISDFSNDGIRCSRRNLSYALSEMGYTKVPGRMKRGDDQHTLWIHDEIEKLNREDMIYLYKKSQF